jgi:hypothetical protein
LLTGEELVPFLVHIRPEKLLARLYVFSGLADQSTRRRALGVGQFNLLGQAPRNHLQVRVAVMIDVGCQREEPIAVFFRNNDPSFLQVRSKIWIVVVIVPKVFAIYDL